MDNKSVSVYLRRVESLFISKETYLLLHSFATKKWSEIFNQTLNWCYYADDLPVCGSYLNFLKLSSLIYLTCFSRSSRFTFSSIDWLSSLGSQTRYTPSLSLESGMWRNLRAALQSTLDLVGASFLYSLWLCEWRFLSIFYDSDRFESFLRRASVSALARSDWCRNAALCDTLALGIQAISVTCCFFLFRLLGYNE